MFLAIVVKLIIWHDDFYPAVSSCFRFFDHLHFLQHFQTIGNGFVRVIVVVLEGFQTNATGFVVKATGQSQVHISARHGPEYGYVVQFPSVQVSQHTECCSDVIETLIIRCHFEK